MYDRTATPSEYPGQREDLNNEQLSFYFVLRTVISCGPLGEADADREAGGGEEDDIEEPLRCRFKQH